MVNSFGKNWKFFSIVFGYDVRVFKGVFGYR